jgi:lysine decarboxylase
MEDVDAPLLAAWRDFVDGDLAPFSIPGHKHRAGTVWPTLGRAVDADVPLFAGLGPMKSATDVLALAEQAGAELWGADRCRYSTGGSTHVNQVAALTVGRPGDTVLVSRTAHRSTLSGLILAGLRPVWLPAEVDAELALPTGVSLSALAAALEAHPQAAAVFLVEPSYVGTLSDVAAAVDLAHAHGVPVVVDQAWGAHFGFHPDYPPHALQAGADVMITSAHKTLPAYTQAALVVARTERIDAERLDRAFEISATTSPAGAILASIDASRALLASATGTERLDALLGIVAGARERLRAAGITAVEPSQVAPGRFDPAKLVLTFDRGDGVAIERELLAAGVPVEQADRDTIVAIVTMLDDASTVVRLVDAVLAAYDPSAQPREVVPSAVWSAPIPPSALTPRGAFFAAHETVAADDAIGRVSAELIAPYPPGIPLLAPGEIITAEVVTALRTAAASGVRIAYAGDCSLNSFLVVIE